MKNHLCDKCIHEFATCKKPKHIKFGCDLIGGKESDDNVVLCSEYVSERIDNEQPKSNIKNYTKFDMYEAFEHGANYIDNDIEIIGDVDWESIPDGKRPFWEWLSIRDKSM